jgi:hypothetical protein
MYVTIFCAVMKGEKSDILRLLLHKRPTFTRLSVDNVWQ